MPIARWICAGCGGREVPLSHFAESACGDSVVHPDFAAAILAHENGQYVSGKVRVSMGLGCPRRSAIEQSEQISLDPIKANTRLTGTAWDAFMRAASNAEPIRLTGVIGGVHVNGELDRLRNGVIEDWKHMKDWNAKYVRSGPKIEHVAQVSMYAELLEQNGMERPTKGRSWGHTSMDNKDALIPNTFDIMPIEQVLEVRPYDCDYTVAELLQQASDFFDKGPETHWSQLPLAGKSIKFGTKTGCDYCSVRAICTEADKGAPF